MFNLLKWVSISIVIAGILASLTYFFVIYLKPRLGQENSEVINSIQIKNTNEINDNSFQKITKYLPFDLTQLEFAITEEQHQKGLMNRKELCSTCGMIFVYKEPDSRTFWMKNTFVSLDIIFLDNDFRVINIASNTKANQTSELYSSQEPSQYILEVPANWAKSKGVDKRSIIDFKSVIEN